MSKRNMKDSKGATISHLIVMVTTTREDCYGISEKM
jgi:hypothetical protein